MRKEKLAIILGGLTLILFSSKPYILDLIEPSKSLGQVIGENAKDLMDSLNGNGAFETTNSKREIWSNIITILSFILCSIAIIFSIDTIQYGSNKWYGIGGGILSILGIGFYFIYLSISLTGLIGIAILVLFMVGVVMVINGG